MTKASAAASVVDGSALIAAASDVERWTSFMPGVVSARRVDDDHAEWRIQSPAGESVVRFRVSSGDGALRYESIAAEAPFLSMAMDVRVAEGTAELDFAIESNPPFPSAMVEQLAQAAMSRLADASLSAAPPPPSADREVVRVPMSDGVQLEAHLYRAAVDVAPCLVTYFPYRKESNFLAMAAAGLVSWGYHFLVADVRGIGGSQGTYEGLWSQREVDDFVELVDWAAAQGWCDGNVATFGGSYCGGNQLLVGARKPAALKCITPIVGMVDTFRDWTHRGGLPSHANWGAMTYLRSQQPSTARSGLEQYYLDFYGNDFDNDAHRARSPEYRLEEIDLPTLTIGGWHDYFLRGTVRTYLKVSGPKRLVIGPWGHGELPPLDELQRWFDHWVRGIGELPRAPVRVFVTGAEEWRDLDDWPNVEPREWRPVASETSLRVVSHVEALPMATNVKPQYMPDPTDSGFSIWSEDATFDTDPFDAPTLMLGHVACHLRLSVDGCEDAAVRVRVSAVRPDGGVRQLNEGRLRLSQRAIDRDRSLLSPDGEIVAPWHPHDGAEPLDGVMDVHVEIDPIGHEFGAGDRLRLGLTFTRADEGTALATATLHPDSRLLLPVL